MNIATLSTATRLPVGSIQYSLEKRLFTLGFTSTFMLLPKEHIMDEYELHDSIDFDSGDVFVADYHPNGFEDLGDNGIFKGVKVQVLEFDDEEAAYGWVIIEPREIAENEG